MSCHWTTPQCINKKSPGEFLIRRGLIYLFHKISLEISNPRRIMDSLMLLLLTLLDLNIPKS